MTAAKKGIFFGIQDRHACSPRVLSVTVTLLAEEYLKYGPTV